MPEGLKGKVYRPNLSFFVYLKLRRGTDVDLQDIRVARDHCPEGFDEQKFRRWASPVLARRFER